MTRPCVHFVGFKDDRYWNAVRIWGLPDFIHRGWDQRAQRDIMEGDTVVFAKGEYTQPPGQYNSPDLDEGNDNAS